MKKNSGQLFQSPAVTVQEGHEESCFTSAEPQTNRLISIMRNMEETIQEITNNAEETGDII